MTVSLEMVAPGLIGLWLDQKLGSKFVLGVLGFAVGLTLAIRHLLRMTSREASAVRRQDRKP
jgi:hypothetical protein